MNTIRNAERIKELVENIIKEEKEKFELNKDKVEGSHEHLFNYLLGMIKWTHSFQDKLKDSKMCRSPKEYAKEFATIKFALPRQSGHTTFAKRLFYGFFKNPIYLAPNPEMVNIVFPRLPNVGSVSNIGNNKFRGLYPDAVIVDCATLISKNEIETIYEYFKDIAYNQENFVFLFLE